MDTSPTIKATSLEKLDHMWSVRLHGEHIYFWGDDVAQRARESREGEIDRWCTANGVAKQVVIWLGSICVILFHSKDDATLFFLAHA